MRTSLIFSHVLLRWAAPVVLALLAGACGTGTGDDGDGRPMVVATTTIIGDIVGRIAQDAVRVEVLIPEGADPHDFAASARQATMLRDAALIVANGVGLEEGLLDVIEAAGDEGASVLLLGELLDPQPLGGGHDNGLDPHVWMDPLRIADGVDILAGRLTAATGLDLELSAASYRAEVLQLHEDIEELVATVPPDRRKLVTNHFAYGYYADRYGFELLGTVIPAATTGAETSAADFAALVDLVEREGVSVIFGSTTEPTTLAEAVAAEVGYEVKVVKLYTGSLGEPGSGAETYVDMMRTSTRLIVEHLTTNDSPAVDSEG